jgi:hypothetical protein
MFNKAEVGSTDQLTARNTPVTTVAEAPTTTSIITVKQAETVLPIDLANPATSQALGQLIIGNQTIAEQHPGASAERLSQLGRDTLELAAYQTSHA